MKALSLDDSLTIAPDVVWRELADEAVILSMATGHYFGLNDVGVRMWQLIRERGSLRRVFEGLLDEFDVEHRRLESDLLTLASTLCANRIALRGPEPAGLPDHTP